ncbi:MAG: DUF4259 domain-containing protein [Candidatus Dormibacteraeota bacterium]|nr:DUF4259 domain-containing protein [Candidatus Dormibacteraeota bacterium]
MGAWGTLAFDNDAAGDWAYDLVEGTDLSAVDGALGDVQAVGGDYLDQDVASVGLAACEVLARLQGRPGYSNAYTAKVDAWAAAHPAQLSPAQIQRGAAVIDRILADPSEPSRTLAGRRPGGRMASRRCRPSRAGDRHR